MATIGAAVDEQTKQAFEARAAARALTASKLAARLIAEFLDRETSGGTTAAPGLLLPASERVMARRGAKTEQVFVRLEPFYFDELGRLAAERDWYRGTYLANLLYVHVDKRPILCADEINAVRQVARQLADIGRNINQVARQLNTSMDNAHQAMALDMELVKMLVDVEVATVKELVFANLKTWGVTDGQ